METSPYLVLLPVAAVLLTQPLARAETTSPGTSTSYAAPSVSAAIAVPTAPDEHESQPETPASAVVNGPVFVRIEADGYAPDNAAVESAIARELATAVTSNEAEAQTQVEVRVQAGGDLVVHLITAPGRDLQRTIKAPTEAAQVPETVALLVGNLARDEAQALLSLLRAPEPTKPVPKATQQPKAPVAAPLPSSPAELPQRKIDLALWYPLSSHSDSERYRFNASLSFAYGRVGAVQGLAFALGVTQIDSSLRGAQFGLFGAINGEGGEGYQGSIFAAHSGGSWRGLQTSEIYAGVDGDLTGAQAALVAWANGAVRGLQAGGLTALAGKQLRGGQFAGLYAQAAAADSAVQAAGLVSLQQAGGKGAQLAGAVNISGSALQGVQVSGVFNLTSGNLRGAQVSLVNLAADVTGAQMGLINIAGKVDGAQIGLVNVAEQVHGASLAPIAYSKSGHKRVRAWFDSTRFANIGLQFAAGALYTMPTFSYHPASSNDADKREIIAPGLSVGTRFEPDPLFIDVQVNASFPSREFEFERLETEMRYVAAVGIEFASRFGVFVGGGAKQETLEPKGASPLLHAGAELRF